MMGIPFFGITQTGLMFALGFGYIICYLAKKTDKGMQGLGHLIGMSIIVLSSLLILLNIYTRFNPPGSMSRRCPEMKAGMMGQAATPSPVKSPVKIKR